MSEKDPVIIGIHHIQIEAPKGCEDAARSFYGGVLGLAEIEKPENLQHRGGVWFACGSQQIHIGVTNNFAPQRKGHPALEVRDLSAGRLRLTSFNIPVSEDMPRWLPRYPRIQ